VLAYLPKSHSRFFHVYYALEALTKVGGKVLDVGCGRGGITMTIKRSFPKLSVTACDKDEGALREFRKDAKRLGIKILKSDAHKLPFKDASFEAVVMFDVLEHLKIPQRAILEAARVTKKGGVFHLVVPIEAELSTLDGWIKKIFGKWAIPALVGLVPKSITISVRKLATGKIKKTILAGSMAIADGISKSGIWCSCSLTASRMAS